MNFLDGYIEAGRRIRSKQARHEFYGSVIDYYGSDSGDIPKFKHEVAEVAFWGVKYSIDKARAGRLGGQADGKANAQANRQANSQAKPKQTPKQTANETPTKEEEEESKEDTPNGVSKKAPAFTAPTAEEVGAYCEERGTPIDSRRFCDYYAAQGWRLSNGNKMRDWKAAARNWADGDRRKKAQVSGDVRFTEYV